MSRYAALILSTLIISLCVSSLVWVATQQSVKAETPKEFKAKESKRETEAVTNKPVKIPKTAATITALDTTSTINATSTAEGTETLSAETTQTLFISEVTATVPSVDTTFTSLAPLSITDSKTTGTAPSDIADTADTADTTGTAPSAVQIPPEQTAASAQPSQDPTTTTPSPFAVKELSTRDMAASIADKYAIPQNLFFALIKQESGWDYKACSRVGALGLTQVMPFNITAMGYDIETFKDSPVLQLELGAKILSENFSTFGRWDYALAAYNAGPNAVIKYGGIPPYEETTNYVRSILAMAKQYESKSK